MREALKLSIAGIFNTSADFQKLLQILTPHIYQWSLQLSHSLLLSEGSLSMITVEKESLIVAGTQGDSAQIKGSVRNKGNFNMKDKDTSSRTGKALENLPRFGRLW